MYIDFRDESKNELELLRTYIDHTDRDRVRAWIGGLGPFRFTGTLNFNRILSKTEAWRHCGVFVRRFHKKTLGRNWREHYRAHQGVAVMEMAPLGRSARSNTPHFHFLLRDHPGLPRCDEEAVAKMDSALAKVAAGIRNSRGRYVCSGAIEVNGFKVVSGDSLNAYLTKQVHGSSWQYSDVRLLSGDGVV